MHLLVTIDEAREALLKAQERYRLQSTPQEWQMFHEALRVYRQALQQEEARSRQGKGHWSKMYG